MRKIPWFFGALIAGLLLARLVFADTARVEELKTEKKQLIERRGEYLQVIKNIEIRLVQINAILDEYAEIEKAEKPEEPKEEVETDTD